MLGISIFLADRSFEENYEYMKQMKSAGFNEIFTTLHMPEDDIEVLKERLIQIGAAAKELDMKIMADISGKVLQQFSIVELMKTGITGLRMDFGFSAKAIADLTQEMKIALNASTITSDFLSELRRFGMCNENIEAWHNY
ncbi:MupG family TIM beta-alpha barrel fold protein, partial [Bacillus massiliigorillae]|uniref:MupG family TIM beta-alpha barrel fold protein n=1 Tax=Bacillus massiliigorillae TaxID=1243664 RepID=UPI0003A96E4B